MRGLAGSHNAQSLRLCLTKRSNCICVSHSTWADFWSIEPKSRISRNFGEKLLFSLEMFIVRHAFAWIGEISALKCCRIFLYSKLLLISFNVKSLIYVRRRNCILPTLHSLQSTPMHESERQWHPESIANIQFYFNVFWFTIASRFFTQESNQFFCFYSLSYRFSSVSTAFTHATITFKVNARTPTLTLLLFCLMDFGEYEILLYSHNAHICRTTTTRFRTTSKHNNYAAIRANYVRRPSLLSQ